MCLAPFLVGCAICCWRRVVQTEQRATAEDHNSLVGQCYFCYHLCRSCKWIQMKQLGHLHKIRELLFVFLIPIQSIKPLNMKSKNCWLLRVVIVVSFWTQDASDIPDNKFFLIWDVASRTICGGNRPSKWRKLLECDSLRSWRIQIIAISEANSVWSGKQN